MAFWKHWQERDCNETRPLAGEFRKFLRKSFDVKSKFVYPPTCVGTMREASKGLVTGVKLTIQVPMAVFRTLIIGKCKHGLKLQNQTQTHIQHSNNSHWIWPNDIICTPWFITFCRFYWCLSQCKCDSYISWILVSHKSVDIPRLTSY